MQRDILQTADGDIKLVDGDIVWGDASEQHQKDLLEARHGDIRTRPDVGVGIEDFLSDDNPDDLYRRIRVEYAADGLKIKSLKIDNGKIVVDADY